MLRRLQTDQLISLRSQTDLTYDRSMMLMLMLHASVFLFLLKVGEEFAIAAVRNVFLDRTWPRPVVPCPSIKYEVKFYLALYL